ncbi:Uncharacterized protein dnl_60870 [Desulfonema limicola]|uniref:Uncharacterized protein n=1 Tax=Desulfonema limicola TaxID=45656 RepID=A0A975BE68_9BACT|nr:hypothetical protein [Desulfonema limicola]QTA83673.1 Uncharacterized protein dnl_60870 [Desulfonema limicola]
MNNEQKIDKSSTEENTVDLTDGMIITPSFYKKKKKSVKTDDEEPILDLDSQSFLDDEDEPVDLNAQTIAISKDNLNSPDFLSFTDSENAQDSEQPFDPETIFASGGDLDDIEETDVSDKIKNPEDYDDESVFELGQAILYEDEIPEQEQTIDLNADTISNTDTINISEKSKSDSDISDDLFSDFDTKTIIAPNGDLDSLDFDEPGEEDFDINAETLIYSGSDLDETSDLNSGIKDQEDDDDNEPLDLDEILDASDVNTDFIDAATVNMSENDIFQDNEDFSEQILDSGSTISIDPDTFIKETDNNEEPFVRDSTTMDGRDAEDAVISLEEATVLDLEEDAAIEPVVIEPVETTPYVPDSDENIPAQDEDDILDLDILQTVSSLDQIEKQEHEDTALDLINSLGDSDKPSEIEEPEDFLDALDLDPASFSQDEDDLEIMLNQGMKTIEEHDLEISDKQEAEPELPEPKDMSEPEDMPEPEETLAASISSAQIEASIERVINKIFSERIEKILIKVVEKAVSDEIAKFRASLMEDLTDEGHF